jgi:uncharacterized protein (TIGR03435 family)
MTRSTIVLLFVLSALQLRSQTPAFEVATVRPHRPDPSGTSGMSAGNGRLTATGTTLKILIGGAYGVRQDQISGGPGWLDSERFDVVGKAENKATGRELWVMVQPLLAERFKLAFHRETKETTISMLVLAKKGPTMRKAAEDAGGSMSMRPGLMTAEKMTMSVFAQILSSYVQGPVIDATGLEGGYAIKFEYRPDAAATGEGPSLTTALQDQLGLKLESRKGPVELLIIDHAERPPVN